MTSLRPPKRRCVGCRQTAAAISLVLALWSIGPASAQPVPPPPPGVVPQGVPGGQLVVAPGGRMLPITGAPNGPGATTLGGQYFIVGGPQGRDFTGPFVTTSGNKISQAFSPQSGLQLAVDMSWPGLYGYRPIIFAFKAQSPAPADQKITVQVQAGDWQDQGRAISVTGDLVFAKGATAATYTLVVPQYLSWQLCRWRVEADGQLDEALSVDQAAYPGEGAGIGMTIMSTTPGVDDAWLSQTLQTSQVGPVSARRLPGGDLPTNWMAYTSLDLFVLRADELSSFRNDHPRQLGALLRWVRAGGNVWIVGCGAEWEKLPAVESQLALEPTSAPNDKEEKNDADSLRKRGWRTVPRGARAQEALSGALALSDFDLSEPPPKGAAPSPPDKGATVAQFALNSEVLVHSCGLGVLAAFSASPGGFGQPTQPVAAVDGTLLQQRLVWSNRHGLTPDQPHPEFNNWLIPNVGVAPVGMFQFLLTLFVLGIGPLNYWLLLRKRKLPLLLVTVPLAAAATTLVLFAYGLLADGFGVRVRARSVTLLDQTAGEAASWARLSYYAGVAPQYGLMLPGDQVLYPILPTWAVDSNFGRQVEPARVLNWADGQKLRSGWLASRTPTEYLAIAARKSSKLLEFRAADVGIKVTNRLGTAVRQLVVEDHVGKRYWCENLADGQSMMAAETDQSTIAGKVRRTFSDNFTQYAPGSEPGSGYYGPRLSENLLETELEAINSPQVESWGRGTYLAFTDRGVEIDLGVDDAVEDASFHVVCGRW